MSKLAPRHLRKRAMLTSVAAVAALAMTGVAPASADAAWNWNPYPASYSIHKYSSLATEARAEAATQDTYDADIELKFDQLRGGWRPLKATVETTADAKVNDCVGFRCEAAAVSVHLTLINSRDLRELNASARANAFNENCTDCRSAAATYQIIAAGPGLSMWRAPGLWQALQEARAELSQLTGQESDLNDRVDEIGDRLTEAVAAAFGLPQAGPQALRDSETRNTVGQLLVSKDYDEGAAEK